MTVYIVSIDEYLYIVNINLSSTLHLISTDNHMFDRYKFIEIIDIVLFLMLNKFLK